MATKAKEFSAKELPVLAEIIRENLGYNVKPGRTSAQKILIISLPDGTTAHIGEAYGCIVATDRIPGLPCSGGFGHGEWRYQIHI